MGSDGINRFDHIVVPVFELDEKGHVKPNPLFHRPIDCLHSRCVEYPFAASQLGNVKKILDVGSVKSNKAWISWLESLPIEVHATDYDEPNLAFRQVVFHRADIRRLPMPDESFDKVIAVSVIEHIGLESPQTMNPQAPVVSEEGDIQAVKELARVLKPGGELIMTLPFGVTDGLVLGDQARSYTVDSIKKFEMLMKPVYLEYYEYRGINSISQQKPNAPASLTLKDKAYAKIKRATRRFHEDVYSMTNFKGEVTWENTSIYCAKATNKRHIDGVLCGVWRKLE